MVKKTKAKSASRKDGPADDSVASGSPWTSSPNNAEQSSTAAKTVSPTVSMGPAETPRVDAWQWNDTFEFAPWASGSASAPMAGGAAPMSREARARLQSTLDRIRDADPIENYENPWGSGEDASGQRQPLNRRDAIRARAAAKRRAELEHERESVTSQFTETPGASRDGGEAADETRKSAKKRRGKKKAGSAKTIPVENLPLGVVNVIGDGIVAVVDGTIAAGGTVSSAIKPVVRFIPPATTAGLICVAGAGAFYGYSSAFHHFPWKL